MPRWRGTGYLYSRFRPGLGTVVVVLTLIAAGMQYIAGQINYRQEKKRILEFIANARTQMIHDAPKGRAPTLGRTYIEVGQRHMRCEVKSDTAIAVYPDERTAEPILLDAEWVTQPTVQSLFLVRWPKLLINKITGKKEEVEEVTESEYEDEVKDEAETTATESPKRTPKKTRRTGGEKVNVMGAKVGGRRRATKN